MGTKMHAAVISAIKADPALSQASKDALVALVSLPDPVAERQPNTFYQTVIVGKRDARLARKALAAKLRAQGIEPNGQAWIDAKKKAGIA